MRKHQSIGEGGGELSSHDRILMAGRELFAGEGYENTTTSAIARRAGTSESQLIKHFGSKEGLLEAIYEQAWQRMAPRLEQIQAGSDPVDALKRLTELMIASLERDLEIRTLMLLESRRIRKHGHQVLLTRGFHQMVDVLDQVLHQTRDRGLLRPDLHPEAVRSALIGAFEGLLRDQLLAERASFPARYDGTELRAAFAAVLGSFLVQGDGRA